jgi:hypothetical protein
MAITVVTTGVGAGSGITIPFTLGVAPIAGDLILHFATGAFTSNAPFEATDWLNVIFDATTLHRFLCQSHVVTTAEANASTVTWTHKMWTANTAYESVAIAVRGQGASFLNANTTKVVASSTVSQVMSAVTPTVTGGLVVGAIGKRTGASSFTYTDPSGWTRRNYSNATWDGPTIVFTRDLATVSGTPTVDTTSTCSGSDLYVSLTLVVAPPPAPSIYWGTRIK